MMADFLLAYKITMKHEGGYANDPDDSGGETWKGIARKKHPNWVGWDMVDEYRTKPGFPNNLYTAPGLQELVWLFYKKEFWDTLRLDEIGSQNIANELFDTSVNMGQVIAATFLQRALNVSNRQQKDYPDLVVDGKIGPKTISATNTHPRIGQLFKLLNTLQGARYISICESNPSQEKYLTGWMERVSLQ
jgi:lysozyme family protein